MLLFSSSKRPMRLLKQNNDILFATVKSLVTASFDRKGIFETVWLSLNNWNKISNQQLRKLLKISQEST